MAKKLIECAECGRESINGGMGLCPSCYGKLKRQKQLQKIESLERALEEKSPPSDGIEECKTVLVDFSRRPAVYEELLKRADTELRPLGLQVLWEVARAMEGGAA